MIVNQKSYVPPTDNFTPPSLIELGHVTGVSEQYHSVNVEGYRSGVEYPLVKVAGKGYWLPQVGDMVVLAFIDGSNENPIVLNKVMGADNGLYSSKKDDIHIDHVIKDENGKTTGRIELHTDKNGNLNLNLGGLKGNLVINANGAEGNIYFHGKGALKINVVGDAEIESSGNINLLAMGNAEIECDGDINAVSRGNANLSAEGNINIQSKTEEGIININNGEKGIARKDDKIKSDASTEDKYWAWLAGFIGKINAWVPVQTDGGTALSVALTTFLATNPVPSSMTGKIIESSDSVKAGD